MASQSFCLKWDNFHSTMVSEFDTLRLQEDLTDITLCCDGARIGAHRIILSACSPYFKDVIKNNSCQHMVFFIRDASPFVLRALVDFMYRGQVDISQRQLAGFLKTAEMLQIRGLTSDHNSFQETFCQSDAAEVGLKEAGASCASEVAGHRQTASPARSTSSQQPQLSPASPRRGSSALVRHAPPSGFRRDSTASSTEDSGDASAMRQRQSADAMDDSAAVYNGVMVKLEQDAAEMNHAHRQPMIFDDLSEAGMNQLTATGSMQLVAAASLDYHTSSYSSLSEQNSISCPVCGKQYGSRVALQHHSKKHQGLTTCSLCGKVCSTVSHLRRHLVDAHHLSQEQVTRMVPTRTRFTANDLPPPCPNTDASGTADFV